VRTVVAGLGELLVVFKAGIDVGASVWVTVQPLVAAETRTLKRSFDGSRARTPCHVDSEARQQLGRP
jgi:hypothetical protein